MTQSTVDRYVLLGLQLGRHEEGLVDAYFGDPELAASVADAEPIAPATLLADADALLAELEDGWLRDQVMGLRTYAGVLAGDAGSYADEVAGCYGVRPVHTDEATFTAAHERLAELLPGEGPVYARYKAWRDSMIVPGELIEPTVTAVLEGVREWTRGLIALPDGEQVELEIVRDEPWLAFNYYVGGLRSRMAVNVDLPITALDLLQLVIHETYPGHHTERALKDQLLVQGQGLAEETIVMVPTPQSIIAEGIASFAPSLVLESEQGEALADIVRAAGIDFDLQLALAVHRASEPCRWSEVNAALMLHEHGADHADVAAYLQRWGLLEPDIAAHIIRFMTEPTSRTYVITYPAGDALCRAYVGDDVARFRTLLTEQVRVGDLLAAHG